MKKINILLIVLILPLILAGCGKQEEEAQPTIKKQVEIQRIVKQDEVVADLVLNGTIVPKEYSIIRSLTPGTIEYLAPVGSEVFMGQPLFSIRDSGIESGYFNALQSYEQTKVVTGQRVQQAELALNSSQARLDLAQSQYNNVIAQTDQATRVSQDSATVAYNSAYNSIYQIIFDYNVGNSLDNPMYIFHDLVTTDPELKTNTTFLFNNAVSQFQTLSEVVSVDNLENDLDQIHEKLLVFKNLADNTAVLLQNAIPTQIYTEATIQNNKLINTGYQTSVNTYVNSIISSINSLENTKVSNQLSIDQAQSQLDLANIEFNNATIAAQSAKDGADLEQSIAQSQFDGAAYSYNNLTLASPFSGTILSHFVTEGEQTSIGQQLIEVGNLDIIEISVDIDVDFAKAVNLGDEVIIDNKYAGFVSEIEPIGDLTSGKISIKVQSQDNQNDLVAGAVSEVKFSLKYQDIDSIVIPIKAATIEASGNYVFVIDDNNIVSRKSVTLGKVFSDKVSVVSGLAEDDKLVLLNGVFVSEGDEVEVIAEQ